jgi:hypothetical protein
MEKKNSKKQSWVCKHGCPESKTPCKHLDRSLPAMNRGNMSMNAMVEHREIVTRQLTPNETNLEKFLIKYGLQEYEVDLIMDRYIGNLSLREITEAQGYTQHNTVSRLIDQITLRLSKSADFKRLLKEAMKDEGHFND